MSERILQEFYCNDCDGFFLANINLSLNLKVLVVCPNCGRKHPREIKKGLIYEGYGEGQGEEIMPTKATYQKQPHTSRMKRHARGGMPLDERWLEVAARERGEI